MRYSVIAPLASVSVVAAMQIGITPHLHEEGQYSSSIGALKCHVDLAHVASFPGLDPCNPKCFKLTSDVNPEGYLVFAIDQSAGAWDVSLSAYKAVTGKPGIDGAVTVNAEELPSSACASYWDGAVTGLNANIYFECPAGSFSRDNAKLIDYEIQCAIGTGKTCKVPTDGSSYVQCPDPSGGADSGPAAIKSETTPTSSAGQSSSTSSAFEPTPSSSEYDGSSLAAQNETMPVSKGPVDESTNSTAPIIDDEQEDGCPPNAWKCLDNNLSHCVYGKWTTVLDCGELTCVGDASPYCVNTQYTPRRN